MLISHKPQEKPSHVDRQTLTPTQDFRVSVDKLAFPIFLYSKKKPEKVTSFSGFFRMLIIYLSS